MCVSPRITLVTFTMLRKGSELQKKDKEVLLDLDYKGSTKSYGSLQNRNFIAQKSVSTLLL